MLPLADSWVFETFAKCRARNNDTTRNLGVMYNRRCVRLFRFGWVLRGCYQCYRCMDALFLFMRWKWTRFPCLTYGLARKACPRPKSSAIPPPPTPLGSICPLLLLLPSPPSLHSFPYRVLEWLYQWQRKPSLEQRPWSLQFGLCEKKKSGESQLKNFVKKPCNLVPNSVHSMSSSVHKQPGLINFHPGAGNICHHSSVLRNKFSWKNKSEWGLFSFFHVKVFFFFHFTECRSWVCPLNGSFQGSFSKSN